MKIALKIDIDTYVGMRKGVPNLMNILDKFGVKASFFVTFGPDNSGKAIRRIFTQPGFFKKMLRTNAVGMFGIKTVFYGTLLPAPLIGLSFPDLLEELKGKGHEVALHAYDHVKWHDFLNELTEDEILTEFKKGVKAYSDIFGEPPQSDPGVETGLEKRRGLPGRNIGAHHKGRFRSDPGLFIKGLRLRD